MNSSDEKQQGIVVDPLAWLNSLHAAAADQVGSPASMAESSPSRLVAGMGSADPTWAFTSEGQAQETQQAVGQICRNHCPINTRCVEERCRFFRLELEAQRYIDEGPEGEGWIVEMTGRQPS